MRALTIRQPWAWAIAAGWKRVENRGWSTAYRGPLAIHAAAEVDHSPGGFPNRDAARALDRLGGRNNCWNPARYATSRPDSPTLALGAVIAVAQLVDAHPATDGCCAPWGDPVYRGRTARHLVLADVRQIADPVPCRGALGLWRPPADVLERIEAAT